MPKVTIQNVDAKRQIYVANKKFHRRTHPTSNLLMSKVEGDLFQLKDDKVKEWNDFIYNDYGPRKYDYVAWEHNHKVLKKHDFHYCNRCDVFKSSKHFKFKHNQCKDCTKETREDGQDVKRLYKSLKRDYKDECRRLIRGFEVKGGLSFKKYLTRFICCEMEKKLNPTMLKFMEDAEKRGYYCVIDENHVKYDPYFLNAQKRKPQKNGQWWWDNSFIAHPKIGTLEGWFEFKELLREFVMLTGVRQSAKKRYLS